MSAHPPDNEFQALLDAAVDGIVVIDHLGRIQVFSRAAERLFGYRAQELLGNNVTVLMTEPDRSEHDRHLARYVSTRYPHIIGRGREVMARRKDGSVFPAFLSVGAVSGEPLRFVGFVQDLTARRRREEEALRLQERLWHVSRLATVGETASGIARELKQPLSAIADVAEACDRLLARPDANLPELHAELRAITSQARQVGDIISRLRGLSRQQDGPRELTDINALISELSVLVESDAHAHNVGYRLELDEQLPRLELDRAQIQQVILNLVRNAIEACEDTPEGQRAIVVRSSRAPRGEVEVSVCDTGPGVSASLLPHLFEPFRTSKPAGTGLGLAISRTIVTRHHGTLEYRANVPVGACFIMRLPASDDEV